MSLASTIASAVGTTVNNAMQLHAKGLMGANANAVSRVAQNAQAEYNSNAANIANTLGTDRIAEQYAFNSGQAAMANQFTASMWDKSAAWNEEMFNKQMEFNREQAQINRDWQERMMSTAYQRAVADMEKAGLNPALAVTGGGISTGSGGGSAASVSSPSMSGAQGVQASGGLLNGVSSNISSYTGQLEAVGGLLGLMGGVINSLTTAQKYFNQMTSYDNQGSNYSVFNFVKDILEYKKDERAQEQYDRQINNPNTKFNQFLNNIFDRWSYGDYNPYDDSYHRGSGNRR